MRTKKHRLLLRFPVVQLCESLKSFFMALGGKVQLTEKTAGENEKGPGVWELHFSVEIK